jgi:2-dehydropantoate 2-reductase
MDGKSKFKIAVVGIGGVGGYVGGKLAARFESSDEVEVVLAARGANEKAIRAGGLRLVTDGGEQVVKPKLIQASEIGDADLLLLCTKEYDLEETVSALKNSIGKQTVILPLLNGVDSTDRIARILPENEIWRGCIYIVSRLIEPGVVEQSGDVCLIYFGDGKEKTEKSEFVENVFQEAGIDARFAEDIVAKTWDKFIFISAVAAATAYLDADFSEVFAGAENKQLLDELLAEIKRVAAAKKINFSETAVRQTLDKLEKMPPGATSSMHRDFSRGGKAELESLVGYVVEQAKALNVPTPVYERVYDELKSRQKLAAKGG